LDGGAGRYGWNGRRAANSAFLSSPGSNLRPRSGPHCLRCAPGRSGTGCYLAGDEDAGTNVLGGQNPAIGPQPFYNGGWIQPGGDTQVVKDFGSLSYPLFPQAGGQVNETLQFSCCTFGRSGRSIRASLSTSGRKAMAPFRTSPAGGHLPGSFDEVRWRDTFADVTPFLTPVPEPGLLGLLIVGSGAVAYRRRR